MANKAQWVAKIKSWIPAWFYQNNSIECALIQAAAKVLEAAEAERDAEVSQTYIGKATGGILALYGDERNLVREKGEFTNDFRKRIVASPLGSYANPPSLVELVDKILIRGKSAIKEDFETGTYLNRQSFLNRGEITVQPIVNGFTIVVDRQVHAPFSFIGRNAFCNRGTFVGQQGSSRKVFENIVRVVNENKALGFPYRIVERIN